MPSDLTDVWRDEDSDYWREDYGIVVAIREDGSYRIEPDDDPYDPAEDVKKLYGSLDNVRSVCNSEGVEETTREGRIK